MFYLILAIVSSACVSLFMRCGEKKISNNMAMFSANYLVCVILARYFMGNVKVFTVESLSGFAAGLGIVSGILFLGSFVMLQYSIRKNGVILSSVFMKLGIIIPTLAAIVIFGEKPRILQIVGILIAIAAIVMINLEKEESDRKTYKLLLIMLLLAGGITDSMSNTYDKVGNPEFKDYFLFYTFLAALLCAVALMLVKRKSISVNDLIWGIAIGVPNYFSARFLLLSLGDVPAIIVYPVYSVATIATVSLVSVVMFREKLGRRKIAAIGLILVALVMINV